MDPRFFLHEGRPGHEEILPRYEEILPRYEEMLPRYERRSWEVHEGDVDVAVHTPKPPLQPSWHSLHPMPAEVSTNSQHLAMSPGSRISYEARILHDSGPPRGAVSTTPPLMGQ